MKGDDLHVEGRREKSSVAFLLKILRWTEKGCETGEKLGELLGSAL